MPHGKKPTMHKSVTRTLPASQLFDFLGLQRTRAARNLKKGARRARVRQDYAREALRSRARYISHRRNRRARRR